VAPCGGKFAIKFAAFRPIVSFVSSRRSITGHSGDTRAALTDTLPVGAGMIPLGVAFGILVTQAGLAWWWTPAISGLLFAGSLEFLLLSLMTAGAPLATIALTTLLVNSRHVFYCLTFPRSTYPAEPLGGLKPASASPQPTDLGLTLDF
jgi:predicted branched-subunit amino acid permease